MLNIFPSITGIFVARHLKISHSAAVELSWLAFWNGLSLRREVSTQPKVAGGGQRSPATADSRSGWRGFTTASIYGHPGMGGRSP